MVVAKKISSVNIFSLILYTILSSLPLLLVNLVSDLPISISNWESKVNDILNLNFPEDSNLTFFMAYPKVFHDNFYLLLIVSDFIFFYLQRNQ